LGCYTVAVAILHVNKTWNYVKTKIYFGHISLISSQNEKIFGQILWIESKHILWAGFFFPRKSYLLRNIVEKYCTAGQATNDHVAHTHFMLDTQGYKHILRMCSDFCFCTPTMVARTRLSVTLYVHCLSCYNRDGVCLLRGTNCLVKFGSGIVEE